MTIEIVTTMMAKNRLLKAGKYKDLVVEGDLNDNKYTPPKIMIFACVQHSKRHFPFFCLASST